MPSLFPRFTVVVRFPPRRPTRFARVFSLRGARIGASDGSNPSFWLWSALCPRSHSRRIGFHADQCLFCGFWREREVEINFGLVNEQWK